jgi:hypothetical protein
MTRKNIILNPDIQESGNEIEGCIFLAKGNIEIEEGNRKSGGSVGYDYIEGFMIADSQIVIKEADKTESVRDAIEIRGGLVALGNTTTSSAILLQRNLRLYNYLNPALVVNWHVKYGKLSEIFFGTEAAMYKQEVGFKVF